MSKQNHFHNFSGILASIVLVACVIGAVMYVYGHFKNLKKDITMNDVKIETITEGTGNPARVGDTVVVHYAGTLEDGFEFDNSFKRGEPFPVTIGEGRVIKGWETGLQGIKVGEKRRLTIPPSMGYGDHEIQGLIPANSVLIFVIEAVEIQPHA